MADDIHKVSRVDNERTTVKLIKSEVELLGSQGPGHTSNSLVKATEVRLLP